jgi:ADP-heptose:LPS heptosyltransferase
MRHLIVRVGAAWGDILMVTPLLRYLKSRGDEVYMLTGEAGQEVLKGNPNIDKLIFYAKDSVPLDKFGEFIEATAKAHECDSTIDLCESIEVNLAKIPEDPDYNLPKTERAVQCNKNYYEETFRIAFKKAGIEEEIPKESKIYKPEVFFDEKEENDFLQFRSDILGHKLIVIGLSGSGRNKTFPLIDVLVNHILSTYREVKVVTVGDYACKLLENGMKRHKRLIHKAGEWTMRQSMMAVKHAALTISPDTGLLHAAGCWDGAKIGLFGHSTIENVTKHFTNDFSIEAEVDCAPCFRLIYSAETQCPIDENGGACFCMALGLPLGKIYKRIEGALNGS